MERNVERRQKKPDKNTRKRQSDKTKRKGTAKRQKSKDKETRQRGKTKKRFNLALIRALALLPHGRKGAPGAEALGPVKVALRVLPPWPSLHITQLLDNTRMPNLPSPHHPVHTRL